MSSNREYLTCYCPNAGLCWQGHQKKVPLVTLSPTPVTLDGITPSPIYSVFTRLLHSPKVQAKMHTPNPNPAQKPYCKSPDTLAVLPLTCTPYNPNCFTVPKCRPKQQESLPWSLHILVHQCCLQGNKSPVPWNIVRVKAYTLLMQAVFSKGCCWDLARWPTCLCLGSKKKKKLLYAYIRHTYNMQ